MSKKYKHKLDNGSKHNNILHFISMIGIFLALITLGSFIFC